MGLGKTICSIALILLNKEMKEDINQGQAVKKVKTERKKANTLLIVQLSIFEHWKKEIEKHSIPNKLEVYDCYSLD
jgi:SNF2 family DNA or RNA helicase